MKKLSIAILGIAAALSAAATAQAPANATGQCKDGTYTDAPSKSGACSGHKGVQTWYATAYSKPAASPAPAARPAPAPMAKPAPAAKAAKPAMPTSSVGATGQCKDGTYTDAPSKSGACSGHKGVQTWYAATPAKSAPINTPMNTPMQTPAPTQAARPAPMAPMAPAPARPQAQKQMAPSTTPQPGGGPGLVWVNTATKVYHCQGDHYYGTTKAGQYVSESAAKQMGARPDDGKVCTK